MLPVTAVDEYICSRTAVITVGRSTLAYASGNAMEPIAAMASASVDRASRTTTAWDATGSDSGRDGNGDGFSATEQAYFGCLRPMLFRTPVVA
jgi:hypothetical protein